MNFFSLTNIIVAISCLLMGILMFLRGGTRKENKIWGYLCFSVVIWACGAFIVSVVSEMKDVAFLWWRISYVGVICVPVFFFHFVYSYLSITKRWVLFTSYILAILFLFCNFFRKGFFFLGDVKYLFDQFYYADWFEYKNPSFIIFYILFYCLLLGYSFILLLRAYKNSVGLRRQQLKYFIAGSVVGFLGAEPVFFPIFGIDIYPFSNLFIALYPVIMGYAIIRHQLMDIEIIIKKTLIFAGLFAVSYGVFASFAYVGSIFFENITQNRWIALIPSVFVIVLMVRPLENFLINATDKFLFQKKYDYRELLNMFANEVITVLDLRRLVDLSVDKLSEVVKLTDTSLLLYDDEHDGYKIDASTSPDLVGHSMRSSEVLIVYMRETGRYILRQAQKKKTDLSPGIERGIDRLNADLVVPLMQGDNMIGVLSFGKKKSDEEFTQDDIDILLPIARTLSIAVTNAQLFEKLSEAQAHAAQREKMAVIGTLSAGINHEICNPLGIARGQCEMFLLNLEDGLYKDKDRSELIDKASTIMQKVIHETDRATAITRKLAAFAKPAKGKVKDDINIEAELDEVLDLLGHDLKTNNVMIKKDIEDDLPCIVADRKQIQEVFFNIIRNAAQAIESGGEIILRALTTENGRVQVEIEDTGEGISSLHLNQIFNPFFTTKDPGKGTGLGLFIVKQVVEKNKGTINVKSEVGKGTTFTFTFNSSRPEEEDSTEDREVDDKS